MAKVGLLNIDRMAFLGASIDVPQHHSIHDSATNVSCSSHPFSSNFDFDVWHDSVVKDHQFNSVRHFFTVILVIGPN
jgi:hypothetical protein